MASTFKNYTVEGTTGGATLYTVPSATTGVIIGLNLANKSAASVNASVQLGTTYIIKDAPIPVGAALSVLDGKIIAETTEVVTVTTSANTSVDAVLSVLEQS
tara:strand:- start:1276 stop:1581 length:306 start_codon:yes stop_codon:yes gene_type:complete